MYVKLPQAYADPLIMSSDKDKGRVGFMMPEITYFKGHPFIDPSLTPEEIAVLNESLLMPNNNEAYVDSEGHIYICHITVLSPDTGEIDIVYVSKTKDTEERLSYYEDQGVLNQLMSSYNNGKIYNFFIDSNAGTIHPNSELVFDQSYRYYSVREVELDADGRPIYVAGIIRDNAVYNIFINMEEINDETTGNTYRKMRSSLFFKATVDPEGNTIPLPPGAQTIQHGKFYIVEFYDENNVIIDVKMFQAIEAAFLNNDTTIPSNQVVDIKISVIKNGFPFIGEGNKYSLVMGESIDYIQFSIVAVYQDGTTKLITQYLNTARLTMTGFDNIDTSLLNGEFPVVFEYYPEVDPETNVPLGSSITREIMFTVIETVMPALYNVLPVLWTEATSVEATGTRAIYNLKLYTLTETGILQNRSRNLFNSLMIKVPATGEYVTLDSESNPNKAVSVAYDPFAQKLVFEALGDTLGISDYRFELLADNDGSSIQQIKLQIEMDSEGNAQIIIPDTDEYRNPLTSNVMASMSNTSLMSFGSSSRRFGISIPSSNFAVKYGRTIGGTPFVPQYARVYLVKDKTATILNTDISIDPYISTLTIDTVNNATISTMLDTVNAGTDYILVKYMSSDKSLCVNYDIYRIIV